MTVNIPKGEEPPPGEFVNVNESLGLTPENKRRLELLAKNGDAKAAVRLSIYWQYYEQNRRMAKRWLKRAAELGDAQSRQELREWDLQ